MDKLKRGGQPGNKNATKNPNDVRKNRSIKVTDEEWRIIKEKATELKMKASEYILYKVFSD